MKIAPIDQFIIDRVREKRLKANMTQLDLSVELGVSKGLIGNIESAKYAQKYSTAQLNQLAIIFNCSPRDFLPKEPL